MLVWALTICFQRLSLKLEEDCRMIDTSKFCVMMMSRSKVGSMMRRRITCKAEIWAISDYWQSCKMQIAWPTIFLHRYISVRSLTFCSSARASGCGRYLISGGNLRRRRTFLAAVTRKKYKSFKKEKYRDKTETSTDTQTHEKAKPQQSPQHYLTAQNISSI